jgi:hypothetical protein
MKENKKLAIVVRCLGALAGLAGGCIVGGILTVVIVMVANSPLGLKTVWPGVLGGGAIGGLVGLFSPKLGIRLAAILDYLG